ncbi:MAG: protein-L-isoaspartate O-methyltransferase [Azospirillaceae bacterium]|nr:protein-L-isoaspartate O-methyltransferase [Azospirillaceae bacterium]
MIAITDYAAARFHMVEGQLRPNKVTDPALIAALSTVPREQFAPERLRGVAYVDQALAVGGGRYLVEPLVLARLLDEAAIQPTDRALVIGAGAGYLVALLTQLAAAVVALESLPDAAAALRRRFDAPGTVSVVEGPLVQGWSAAAPYDVIVIDGATARIEPAWQEQLAEGGRLVGVVHRPGALGQARLIRRVGAAVSGRTLFEAATPILPELAQKPEFVF